MAVIFLIWMSFLAYIDDDDKRSKSAFIGLLVTVPHAFLGITMVIARYKIVFADLLGIAFLIGFALISVVLDMTS